MYWFSLQDVRFLVKCLKAESDGMKIYKYLTFISSSIRSSTSNKLVHNFSQTSTTQHFYFNRVILLWNALPSIRVLICHSIYLHLWNHFIQNYNLDNPCSFHHIRPCNNVYISSRVWFSCRPYIATPVLGVSLSALLSPVHFHEYFCFHISAVKLLKWKNETLHVSAWSEPSWSQST